MAVGGAVGVSAIMNDDFTYTPGEGVETYTYYFAMPKEWYNGSSATTGDVAGIYWWEGTDPCGAVDGSGGSRPWPGYVADKVTENIFSCQVPTDVSTIIWNNNVDGGTDKTLPKYLEACQGPNTGSEYASEGDFDLWDDMDGFWEEMATATKNGDETVLGSYKNNFFMDGDDVNFTFDNMIYIIDLENKGETFEGKPVYLGQWYFYYGGTEYGAYPTKEQAVAKGSEVGNFADGTYWDKAEEVPTTTVPATVEPGTAPASGDEPSTIDEPVVTGPRIELTPEVSADKKTVNVTVSMLENPGILPGNIEIVFDEAALKLTNVEDKALMPGTASHKPELVSPYTLSWADDLRTENWTDNGALAVLTFEVLDSSKDTVVTVGDKTQFFNADFEEVTFGKVAAKVSFADAPIVTDPVVTDPVTTDPVVTDPVTTDPVVTDPVTTTAPETTVAETTKAASPDSPKTSTTSQVSSVTSGAIQTGVTSIIAVVCAVALAAAGFILYSRKRKEVE